MKKCIFFCFVIMIITASCNVSKTVSSAHTLLPKTDLTIADLDVQTSKVTGEYRYDIQLDKEKSVNKQELVNNAIYNALHPLKADVLVGAQHRIESSSRGNRMYYNVTVTGYPAYYRNFRSSSVKDVEITEIDGQSYVILKNEDGQFTSCQLIVPTNINEGYIKDHSSDLSKDAKAKVSSFDMMYNMIHKQSKKSQKNK